MRPEEIAAEVQAIVDAESADLEKMVARLNDFMRNMWQIEWVGQFRELCEGKSRFATKIRKRFYEDCEIRGTPPISPDIIDDFVEYLQTYGF